MKWLEQHLSLIYEWLMTFSNQKSLFSSKRIERFAVFTTMLTISCIFLIHALIVCTLTATDLMIVVAGWLGYAGFGMVQGRKDKESDSEIKKDEFSIK